MKKLVIGLCMLLMSTGIVFANGNKSPVVTEVNSSTYTAITNTSEYCKSYSIWLEDGSQFIYADDASGTNAAKNPEGSLGLGFPNVSVKGAIVTYVKTVSGTVNCIFQPGE